MTRDDAQRFSEAILVLAATFNEAVNDTRMEAYFGALEDLDIADVVAATRLAIGSCKFFPRPVELRELVHGTAEDAAVAAWEAVRHEISRVGYLGEPKLPAGAWAAVRAVWGSWERLCSTLPAEGPELLGWAKSFRAAFSAGERADAARALTVADCAPNVRAIIGDAAKGWRH